MSKSAEAFRTIGEVADELEVPKHVLRFWEGKFPHIRPMKRGGGRRYYRPEDMELLRGIRHLLHAEGYTIKGVQKILREQGIDQVKAAAAAGAAAAAAESRAAKGRNRAGRTAANHHAPPSAQAKSSATAVANSKTLSDGDGSSRAAQALPHAEAAAPRVSQKDILAAAIRELEMCRKLLVPVPPAAREAAPQKAVRS